MRRSEPSWMVQVAVAKPHRAAFERLTKAMVAAARKEPGTLIYERFADGEGRVVIYERYRSAEAAREHLRQFTKRYAARFSRLARRETFSALGVTDRDLREHLAQYGARAFRRIAGFSRRKH